MIFYLNGFVKQVNTNSIVLDVNNIGYEVVIAKPASYQINDNYLIYTYELIKENEISLIGFASLKEKEVFMSLLKIKGLGPKGIINIFNQVEINQLCEAIKDKNMLFFKGIKGLSSKISNQILLETKISFFDDDSIKKRIKEALKSLGFKVSEINSLIAETNFNNLNEEEALKLALSNLKNKYGK